MSLEERIAEATLKQAGITSQIGEVRGELKAAYLGLMHDPQIVDALRAKAWLNAKPDIHISRDLSNIPNGWPETIKDPDEYLRGELVTRMDARIPKGGARPAEMPVSPSVKKLQEAINERS